MNYREDIVTNLVDVLHDAQNPHFGLVSRDLIDPDQLSRQQFPAIYITTANETREDLTQGGSSGLRRGILEVVLIGWVNGTNIDHQRNDIIERVEEIVDLDRTRNGNAKSTQLVDITVDFDIVEPFGSVEMTLEIYYTYTRGQL
mgnify:CR=1 FL=1|jgi:hypothetical protein